MEEFFCRDGSWFFTPKDPPVVLLVGGVLAFALWFALFVPAMLACRLCGWEGGKR